MSLTNEHSLGWVTARAGGTLLGFVNGLWDALTHAWIQDEMVLPDARRQGIGVALIRIARDVSEGSRLRVA